MHRWISSRIFAIVTMALSLLGCAATGFLGLKDCAPVYGNWCGKDYPHAGEDPPAVDRWDAACRSHDRCIVAGKSKDLCDRLFVAELEKLNRQQLAPRRMLNAHSWFYRDGFLGGTIKVQDEIWAAGASCKGGDGRAAQFSCVSWGGVVCPLNPRRGVGTEGMPCTCNGIPGQVAEQ